MVFLVTAELSGGEQANGVAQLQKPRFCGSMKNHGIKQSKLDSVVKSSVQQVDRDDQSLHPGHLHRASLATAMQ